jgi:histone-binding protein RBBP4
MILTGSSDTVSTPVPLYLSLALMPLQTVGLWDIRNLDRKLHSFECHTGSITQLAWSPHSPLHFASASEDRRIHIWNLDNIGAEQTPDDAEDGPPELMFVHGGHTSNPSDLSWSPIAKWFLASTSEDNVLQIWEPGRHLRAEGEDVDAMELE